MIRFAAALLAASLPAACERAAPDPRGVERDEVLLQVTASGRSDSRPDEARLLLGVQTIGPTSGEASAGNAGRMNEVVAALRRLGVGPDDIQTQALTLRRIDYGAERGRFEANNQVQVRIREVTRAGAVVAAATEAGANLLAGPELRTADPEAAGRSAYANAFRAARARAQAYAEAAGLRVARVLAIRDGGGGAAPPQPYVGDAMMRAQTAAPPPEQGPPVSAGVTTREVRVSVDFALGE